MAASRDEARAALERVFLEVFDDDTLVIFDALAREDLEAWDSLGHIRLVCATEEAFGVSFTIEEIETMTSVSRILDRIAEKY